MRQELTIQDEMVHNGGQSILALRAERFIELGTEVDLQHAQRGCNLGCGVGSLVQMPAETGETQMTQCKMHTCIQVGEMLT